MSESPASAIRVRFAKQLSSPPADRSRRFGIVYPKVAQSKGLRDRKCMTDLCWRWRQLSYPSVTSPLTPIHATSTCTPTPQTRPTVSFKSPSKHLFVVESSPDEYLTNGNNNGLII